jgi:hypothetical protein
MKVLQLFGIVFSLILIVNMILFALRKINGLVFWGVILVGAVLAYFVVPRMR